MRKYKYELARAERRVQVIFFTLAAVSVIVGFVTPLVLEMSAEDGVLMLTGCVVLSIGLATLATRAVVLMSAITDTLIEVLVIALVFAPLILFRGVPGAVRYSGRRLRHLWRLHYAPAVHCVYNLLFGRVRKEE